MTQAEDNGIYYFLGNITNHILHALPLQKEIGGTFVVTSIKAKKEIEQLYNVPIICLDDKPYKWILFGYKPKPIHEYIILDKSLKRTYDFLNSKARVVIFYELFEIKEPEWLIRPKKIFLTHGNMLKSYMTMHPQRLKNVVHYDYIAALSPYMKRRFISDGVPEEKLVDIGISRTDDLIREMSNRETIRQNLIHSLGLDKKKSIILYTPTFWGDSSIHHTGLELCRYISDSHTLLFRPHPQTPKRILRKYEKIISHRDNIRLVNHLASIPITQLVVASDVIIVDRSSIALEAILTNIPLVFAYDTPEPISTKDYESISDIVRYSPSLSLNNIRNINNILNMAIKKGVDKKIWNEVRHQVWFQSNGGATKSIAQLVQSLL